MKYIVRKTTEIIKRNKPEHDGEMMVRVDGFEDVCFYENLAKSIMAAFDGSGLSIDIKLAPNKWEFFKQNPSLTTYLQSLESNQWVAKESITRYRNNHKSNLLVLMGTEQEEDKGGLMNCFCITADTIADDIDEQYSEVFMYLSDFSDSEKEIIDRLYHDLFSYVPVDIFKLSRIADRWENQISNIQDFMELFFSTLNEWGLPVRRMSFPSSKELNGKKNVLELQQKFITRSMFKRTSIKQYGAYQDKLDQYALSNNKFIPSWDGWADQKVKSYEAFSKCIMEFIRGEKTEENRKLLEETDFEIVSSVLDFKLDSPTKPGPISTIKIQGTPLSAFTKALMYSLLGCSEKNIDRVKYNITQAEIVSLFSNASDMDEKEQIIETWKTICRHTNGISDFINQRTWTVDGEDIEVIISPTDIFDPGKALDNYDASHVRAASSNKTISKIEFEINCYSNGKEIKECTQKYVWEFPDNAAWVHDFSDICRQSICIDATKSYIPLASINKMSALIFVKSDEEFFDLYDESDILFDFNIVDFIQKKAGNGASDYVAQFIKLGFAFSKLISIIKEKGFYISAGKGSESEIVKFVNEYVSTGELLLSNTLPENLEWILDAYIHAFNIEADASVLTNDIDARCCIVPSWHPATLQKMLDQKTFFLDGCLEWWNENEEAGTGSKKGIDSVINNLEHMSMIQSSLDIFPSEGQQYFGAVSSFGDFSVYARSDIENTSRLKDIIHKDAIFDDDFDSKEIAQMNDNAKMIYGVIRDYVKSFQTDNNLSLVFVNPMELQPIVAAIYKYIDYVRSNDTLGVINITLKILVKPENKGGRNYLSYWMDEYFSQDANVNIRTYLNEWSTTDDLDKLLNGNNDIVFMMDLLKVNNLVFIKDMGKAGASISECMFPIVYKPAPISDTTVKRKIELSQPQFSASYIHTQVSRYRNNTETLPDGKYIAVREVCIDQNVQDMVYKLHSKAYWVVCVDSGMDGALLKNDGKHKDDYSIIGFSTGKGAYGQYNLTITARKSILGSIKKRLSARLYQLFQWEQEKVEKAANICINEAGKLDGISLFSAVNPKDHNINEFMAYVLTSLREKQKPNNSALKIMIHVDSYKHWFNSNYEKDEDDSSSRPDFLLLEAFDGDDGKLHLKAMVTECKISGEDNMEEHKEKGYKQVCHGIKRLSTIFDPHSRSIKRRYWYAQLYRALAFAQVTFSNDSPEFASLSTKLRAVLDGNFEISWSGQVLGYWIDMQGDTEIAQSTEREDVVFYGIPQTCIQKLLLGENEQVQYVEIPDDILASEEEQAKQIEKREKELQKEIKEMKNKDEMLDDDNPATPNNASSNNQPNSQNADTVAEDYGDKGESNSKPISEPQENKSIVENTEDGDINVPEEKDIDTHENNADDETKSQTGKSNSPTTQNIPIHTGITGNERILIGTDRLSNKVYWEFGNPQLSNRHMLITGTSGNGKTYAIQTMLYELFKFNISAIIFDYTEGFRESQLEEAFKEKVGDRIKQNIIYFSGVPINPFKRHEIDAAGIKMLEKPAAVASRFANILKHVYDFGEQQFAAIYEAVRKGIEEYGDKMNMEYFQKKLDEEKANNKAAQTVYSKMTPFFYSVEFNTSDEFDWGKILYADEAEVNIFQLTTIDHETQIIITELMLWDAWYYTKKVGDKDKPFVCVLDEAQNLSHKKDSPSAAILTEGRKFGWSAWFATQSLKVLADDEVTRLLQSASKLYFKPTEAEIPKIAKQLDPTDSGSWLSPLKNLNKGQCIVVGDRVGASGKFGATKPTVTTVTSFNERD